MGLRYGTMFCDKIRTSRGINMKNYKIGFISLGCSKNLCDTEVMLHHIASAGYEIVAEEHEADIIIINTCAFIESAKKESIDNILDVAWFKSSANPDCSDIRPIRLLMLLSFNILLE